MRTLFAVLVMLSAMLVAAAASAQTASWQASIRPDNKNGGQRIVLVGALNNGAALYAQCDGLRAPMIAFISNDQHNFPALPTDTNVQLSFDIDGNASGGVGAFYDHGGGYLGLQITDPAVVAKIIGDIAKAKFGIGLTIVNKAHSFKNKWAAGINGAPSAAKQFADYCFKGSELPVETAAPTPAPAPAPESTWRVYPAASGGSLVIAADTQPKEGTLYIACAAGGALTLIYLAEKPDVLPFNRTARSVTFKFDIDGFTYGGEGGYYEDERGAGIAFGQKGTIFDMLSVLAIAQTNITMTLQGISGPLYVRDFGVAGAADAGRKFLDSCR